MNALTFFRESKQILAICPCCGEVYRLSEATLYTKERPALTAFDSLDAAWRRFERAESKFAEKEAERRKESVAKGQRAAKRRLKAIAKPFARRGIDPQDVKLIFDPVEFVAFPGLTKGSVKRVELIDRPPGTKARERIQRSVGRTIKAGNYDWCVLRIGVDGRVEARD